MQQLAAQSKSLNIPTIVIVFFCCVQADEKYKERSAYIKLRENLVAKLVDMGFYVFDLYPLYQAKLQEMGWSDMKELWISNEEPMDAHPNGEGHQFIAEKLVEYTHLQPDLIKIFQK